MFEYDFILRFFFFVIAHLFEIRYATMVQHMLLETLQSLVYSVITQTFFFCSP